MVTGIILFAVGVKKTLAHVDERPRRGPGGRAVRRRGALPGRAERVQAPQPRLVELPEAGRRRRRWPCWRRSRRRSPRSLALAIVAAIGLRASWATRPSPTPTTAIACATGRSSAFLRLRRCAAPNSIIEGRESRWSGRRADAPERASSDARSGAFRNTSRAAGERVASCSPSTIYVDPETHPVAVGAKGVAQGARTSQETPRRGDPTRRRDTLPSVMLVCAAQRRRAPADDQDPYARPNSARPRWPGRTAGRGARLARDLGAHRVDDGGGVLEGVGDGGAGVDRQRGDEVAVDLGDEQLAAGDAARVEGGEAGQVRLVGGRGVTDGEGGGGGHGRMVLVGDDKFQ